MNDPEKFNGINGAQSRNRTSDTGIFSPLLLSFSSQGSTPILAYRPLFSRILVF